MCISEQYLAGLFDGEGWVTFTLRPDTGYLRCAVGIGMTLNEDIQPKLLEMYPESVLHQKEQKHIYKWEIAGASAQRFIDAIRPYIIIKRADIQWFDRWSALPKARPRNMSPEILQSRIDFMQEYKEWRQHLYKG